MADGATVTAYVAAPLCGGAKRGLEERDAHAGEVRVRVICLARHERGGRLDLGTVGADARRATEDSTSVAYVEDRGRANRFSRPIVEAAGVAFLVAESGGAAIAETLEAIEAADSSALRDSVAEKLEEGA